MDTFANIKHNSRSILSCKWFLNIAQINKLVETKNTSHANMRT